MNIRSNPHTHTHLVDGHSTAAEMARRAWEAGFVSLGFSEHASQNIDQAYALSAEKEEIYILDVHAVQREYEGRMRVWLGIERDRVSTANSAKYEYILAASHYLTAPDGAFTAVDGDADKLEGFVNANLGGNWARAFNKYFDEYAAYVEATRPNIIAHFDLIAKTNRGGRWFDEFGKPFQDAGMRALERMAKVCPVMEVNTGGIVRSGQPYPYPSLPFLKRWRELGGEVIPASDCHRAHQLTAWFDECPDYLREAGYDHMLELGAGSALFHEIAL